MSVDARREQLLSVGTDLLAESGYDALSIDDVIERAGVSRALFYHYFDGKSEFFRQAVEQASEQLAEAIAPDPNLDPADQLRHAIDAYLRFAAEHERQYLAIYRNSGSGDGAVREVLQASQREKQRQIIASLEREGPVTELVHAAVHAWIAFLIAACLRWLEEGAPDREALTELCADVLRAAIASAAGRG